MVARWVVRKAVPLAAVKAALKAEHLAGRKAVLMVDLSGRKTAGHWVATKAAWLVAHSAALWVARRAESSVARRAERWVADWVALSGMQWVANSVALKAERRDAQ